jgi:hypothetical protein
MLQQFGARTSNRPPVFPEVFNRYPEGVSLPKPPEVAFMR